MKRSEAVNLRQIIESASQSLPNEMALKAVCLHPVWSSGTTYAVGFKVQYNNTLYICLTAHTAQDSWTPDVSPSLWEQINETNAGTIGDPIHYAGNMALESGKYYSQDNTIYLCNRDTVNPVYNPLAELVGIYVEEVLM